MSAQLSLFFSRWMHTALVFIGFGSSRCLLKGMFVLVTLHINRCAGEPSVASWGTFLTFGRFKNMSGPSLLDVLSRSKKIYLNSTMVTDSNQSANSPTVWMEPDTCVKYHGDMRGRRNKFVL